MKRMYSIWFILLLIFYKPRWYKNDWAHLFGLVAASHVFSNVLDAFDGLFDFGWHHGKCHHCVDALGTQLTCHLPHLWCFWGFLLMLAGARTFLPSAALDGRELTVSELQTVQGAASDLLENTTRVQIKFVLNISSELSLFWLNHPVYTLWVRSVFKV